MHTHTRHPSQLNIIFFCSPPFYRVGLDPTQLGSAIRPPTKHNALRHHGYSSTTYPPFIPLSLPSLCYPSPSFPPPCLLSASCGGHGNSTVWACVIDNSPIPRRAACQLTDRSVGADVTSELVCPRLQCLRTLRVCVVCLLVYKNKCLW